MFLLCLYLGIRFAKRGNWSIKSLLPVFASIFILILSHHLSTLYIIVTFFGLSLSLWFFKPQLFKRGALAFFILAIYTYTLWFAYGTLVYPKFFNLYVYSSGYSNLTQLSSNAGILINVIFAIYPAFIILLFFIEFLRTLEIKNPITFFKHLRQKIHEIRIRESDNSVLVFTTGFIFVFILFIVGIGVPVLFGTRILEVLCIGLYPLASQLLIKLVDDDSSKKKKVLIFLVILFVVLTGLYRYYSQIQRRVII
jgi:hypothetical protein